MVGHLEGHQGELGCGPTIQGFGHPTHGFGLPDVQDAVPGSAKRWAAHVEDVCGQRYVCWGRYISGYYRAYFFNIHSTGLNILIAIHSWRLRMCRYWVRTLRVLKMRFRNRKRSTRLDRWLSCAVVPPRSGKQRAMTKTMIVAQIGTRRVIIAATATAINSPFVVFMQHLALPLLVDIFPFSPPSFGQLFVPYRFRGHRTFDRSFLLIHCQIITIRTVRM